MKKFLCMSCVFVTFWCVPCHVEAQEYDECPDEVENLVSLTPDTIINANPRLVQLMNIVYVYTTNPTFFPSSDIRKNLMWMDGFRSKLCAYYKDTRPADNESEYAMADSVISEARRLWNDANVGTTVDMLNYNSIEASFSLFEHYNAYSRLYSVCETDEDQELLAAEFQAWLQLEKQYKEFYRLCVFMSYWKGTMAGVLYGLGQLDISKNHIDLYKKEYVMTSDLYSSVEVNGTFVGPARDLLLGCCRQALDECDVLDIDDDKDYYGKDYEELYKKARILEQQLPKYIDKWIEKRKDWEEKGSCVFHERCSLNTSEVLIKMASLVSCIN